MGVEGRVGAFDVDEPTEATSFLTKVLVKSVVFNCIFIRSCKVVVDKDQSCPVITEL